jgi:glycosyltransferase involved in cell wall biosynthesis
VLGPIGVGVRPPLGLLPSLGAIGAASELVRLLIQSSAQLVNPLVRRSTDRASLILVQNRETLEWLPVRQRPKARVFSRVILQDSPDVSARPAPDRPKRVAVFAGRLLPWKGAHLAIMAMRYAPDWRLRIYGTGPDEARLRRLVARFGLSGRVTFEGWKPRNELMSELATEGSVMLFPSLHEEGGWVVQESVQIGLPVLCLDRGGPPALGGVAVHADRPGATSRRLAAALDGVAGQGAPRDSVRYLDPSRAAVRRILAEGGVTVP